MQAWRSASRVFLRTMSTSLTPMEDAVRRKLTEAFNPSVLKITNNSHLHAHHAAMKGSVSKETHFDVRLVSDAFAGKAQLARHRMVNTLLKDELQAQGGIHALQLKTQTPEEADRQQQQDSVAT